MDSAVDRAIRCIWERYNEPLCLTDIAKSAILSRFHFCRIFRDATGVTPGRFLSAVRIYQAKRMLLTTSMNITDISFAVGYNSLGSFTNHFTDSVGVSPGRFRRMSQNGGFEPPDPQPGWAGPAGTVSGTISLPDGYVSGRVFAGVFDTPIVQRRPLSASLVEIASDLQPAPYRFGCIPDGAWYVHAVGIADTAAPEPWTRRTLLVGDPVVVRITGGGLARASISLRPRQPTDLPVLLALPDLETPLDEIVPTTDSAAYADLTFPRRR